MRRVWGWILAALGGLLAGLAWLTRDDRQDDEARKAAEKAELERIDADRRAAEAAAELERERERAEIEARKQDDLDAVDDDPAGAIDGGISDARRRR